MLLSQEVRRLGDFLKKHNGLISTISCNHVDSRSHSLFVAISGTKFKGEDFISEAIDLGARFIVASYSFTVESVKKNCDVIAKFENIFLLQHRVSCTFKKNTTTLDFSKFFDEKLLCFDCNSFIELNQNQESYIYLFLTDNTRIAYSYLASCFYQKQPKKIFAVTGTNGKTSSCYLLAQIASLNGIKSGSLGTLGLHYFRYSSTSNISEMVYHSYNANTLTTPSAMDLHRYLSLAAYDGIECLALEASSHGLDQHRLDYVKLTGAAFINISHDHLDYHKNYQSYLAAKSKIFHNAYLEHFVFNSNCTERNYIAATIEGHHNFALNQVVDFSINAHDKSKVKLISFCHDNLHIEVLSQEYKVKCYLQSTFQVENLLCAIALAMSIMKVEQIIEAIPHLVNPPGRMEVIELKFEESFGNLKNKAKVYIDYAHSPEGLQIVLIELSQKCLGRLIVLFGCGGNRDREKRQKMGYIASLYSDIIIVTDDNPRDEDPAIIRSDIAEGFDQTQLLNHDKLYYEIADRKKAIKYAINLLQANDILLIAGKGHETVQIIADKKVKHNDKEYVKNIIKSLE